MRVGNECQTSVTSCRVTHSGQVWSRDAGEVVLVERERAIDGCQGGDADGRNVSECQLIGPDQVGEADVQVSSVGSNVGTSSDVGDLCAESLQAVVVVDVQ